MPAAFPTHPLWNPLSPPVEPDWSWELYDFNTDDYLGPLIDIKNRNISPAFGAGGSASFTTPLDSEEAYLIESLSTYLTCRRNSDIVWQGKIWNTDEDAASNVYQVNCLGWFEELNHRATVDDLDWTDRTIGYIGWDLINHTVTEDGPIGFDVGVFQNAGFTIDHYKLGKDLNIASEIQKLMAVENGIDVYFDYEARMFKFVDHYGDDKPSAHFGFNCGPDNLQNFRRITDASRIVTRMKAISPLSGNWVVTDNPTQVTERGVYREVQTLTGLRIPSGLTVEETAAAEAQLLASYGAAETAIRGNPLATYELTLHPPDKISDVPRPFEDFKEGDIIRGSCDQGRLQLEEQEIRCYGFSVNITDNNEEVLTSIDISPT